METIGGQDEMIDVPDDNEPLMEQEVQKGPPPAIKIVIQPFCLKSPSAPQVEHYVDSAGSPMHELSLLPPQDGAMELEPILYVLARGVLLALRGLSSWNLETFRIRRRTKKLFTKYLPRYSGLGFRNHQQHPRPRTTPRAATSHSHL